MGGKFLSEAIEAKSFVDSAIASHPTAIAAANGYLTAAAGTTTALGNAVKSIGIIQTALMPSGALAPPSKIGVNITGAILTQLTTVLTAITAAGVAAPLLPEPTATTTFGTQTGIVTTTLPLISSAITVGLITPQSP
tara:strand:+ start:92 stop:502 length:411 start_codon:yes stop_codon:yes gene_type:complete